MPLSSRERAALRADAHHLDPLLSIGAGGISPPVVQSLEDAFRSHELVKIKVGPTGTVAARDAAAQLAAATNADVVQVIGHTATLFRENLELRAKAAARTKR